MKLLGQPNSINVRKVLWTCTELGIALECEDWGGEARSTHAPEFLALNPKAMVPVLIDDTCEDDLVLTESNAICRYLASSKPESELLPQALKPRAQVDAWMDWQATDLNTAWRGAFMGRVRAHPDFADEATQAASLKAWNAAMSLLNDHLATTSAYVCGAEFSLADIVLALSANRWELTPMTAQERPVLPHVKAWMERLSERAGFVAHCRNGTP